MMHISANLYPVLMSGFFSEVFVPTDRHTDGQLPIETSPTSQTKASTLQRQLPVRFCAYVDRPPTFKQLWT